MITKPWRTGHNGLLRETPEMIFEISGGNSAEDRFVGLLTNEELARHTVAAHNAALRKDKATSLPPESGPVPSYPHEAWQVMLQPDRQLAVFDLQKTRFVLTDASPDAVLDLVRAYTHEATMYETRAILYRVLAEEPAYTTPLSWHRALAHDRQAGGDLWERFTSDGARAAAEEQVELPGVER